MLHLGKVREIFHQDILSPELYECEENPKGEGIANPILNTTLYQGLDKISRTLLTPNPKTQKPPTQKRQKAPVPKEGILSA